MDLRDDKVVSAPEVAGRRATDVSDVRISVVISAHNRGREIDAAIDRVLAQTFAAAEILVVDDGSTDDTVARVARHRDRVRLVRQSRAGRVAAHNRGAELARHEWLAFVDFDALWVDDHLERIALAIASTDGAAGFYFQDGECSDVDGGRTRFAAARFELERAHELVGDAGHWALSQQQPMNLSVAVLCRRTFLEIGGLDAGARRRGADLFFRLSLGRPGCAVAGIGATLSEAVAGVRPQAARRRASVEYLRSQIALYRTALPHVRGTKYWLEVRHRIAVAHWRLARAYARAGWYLCAGWQFLRSGFVSPSVPLNAVHRWRRMRGR